MKVKLCGFTDENSVKAAIANKCDFIGFVFCEKSPRNISPENAAKISANIPEYIAKVAIIADADFEFLAEIYQKFIPDYFQFHGSENPDFLIEFRHKFPTVKIIKAFKISEGSDLNKVADFNNCADIFLFDGKVGGSGEVFDWNIIKTLKTQKEWFLSGGLNISNIAQALEVTGAKMIDISSGIEETRGQKSTKLISEFMDKVKR